MTHMLGVESQVGQLRHAIVHRPGLELTRLTPSSCDELRFDDVLWADKASQEHLAEKRLHTIKAVLVNALGAGS